MTIGHLPQLPLVCLKSADSRNTEDVVKGKATIIDFWTTKCEQCPSALDKLDRMAQDPKYSDVQFVSICCDKLDGARNIIEKDDDLRWQHVNHYFMDKDDKEEAKRQLGFRSVPFYVFVDEEGEIQQMGSERKVDFDEVPGVVPPPKQQQPVEEGKHNDNFLYTVDDGFDSVPQIVRPPQFTSNREKGMHWSGSNTVNSSIRMINSDFPKVSQRPKSPDSVPKFEERVFTISDDF